MKANRKRDTKPELLLRRELHAQGLRYRVNFRIRAAGRTIRPDIVFTRAKVAVFVDGCFWHGCPQHGVSPRTNSDYWLPKLASNRARDLVVDAALRSDGWEVVRLWEHEPIASAGHHVLRSTANAKRP